MKLKSTEIPACMQSIVTNYLLWSQVCASAQKRRKLYIALCGEVALEGALDLS